MDYFCAPCPSTPRDTDAHTTILALGRQRQEDCLGFIIDPNSNQPAKNKDWWCGSVVEHSTNMASVPSATKENVF